MLANSQWGQRIARIRCRAGIYAVVHPRRRTEGSAWPMQTVCRNPRCWPIAASTVRVAGPQPIIQGLEKVELVDLYDGSTRDVLKPDEFANGGMLRLTPDLY